MKLQTYVTSCVVDKAHNGTGGKAIATVMKGNKAFYIDVLTNLPSGGMAIKVNGKAALTPIDYR
jgi:hypothetical protein